MWQLRSSPKCRGDKSTTIGAVCAIVVGVFVKTTRRRRGDKTYEYLSLVEAVRDGERTGHRTLLRLGEVSALQASGQLARIVAALQRHLEHEAVASADVEVDVGALSAEAARSIGATAAVAALWRRLRLDTHFWAVGVERGAEVLPDAVLAMIANRLIDPCSKRRLPEWIDADVVMPATFVAP